MRKPGTYYKIILIFLLPLGMVLNSISRQNTAITEKVYSNHVYKALSQVLSAVTGLLPFSIAEVLLILFVLFVLWRAVVFCRKMVRERDGRFGLLKNAVLNILAFAGVLYFCFVGMWGMNYNRVSLSHILQLEVKPASVDELEGLCRSLIERANELRPRVHEDKDGVAYPEKGYGDVLRRASLGYDAAAEVYREFEGRYGPPKPVLMLSHFMSYINIWGIYCPFTVEANVNTTIPSPLFASTVCHEMAHQRGFAREDEANYIAYMTCSIHPDDEFKYSGVLHALTYSMDALYGKNPELYKELRAGYGEGIKRDLQAMSRYFDKYENHLLQDISSTTNDLYLKANNQKDGEQSYGRMVDLLIAEYRAKRK